MSLEDMSLFDNEGNKISYEEAIANKEGNTIGIRLEGQGVIEILINGKMRLLTFRATNREMLELVFKNVVNILYDES